MIQNDTELADETDLVTFEVSVLLRKLYESRWEGFEAFVKAHPNMSSPLLIDVPTSYFKQPLKLFVVGQQTRTWYNEIIRENAGTAAIKVLMDTYKGKFYLGLSMRKSPFWQFVRALEREVKIKPGAILWSNVSKVDENARRLSDDMHEQATRKFEVLAEEIRVCQPDVVVFLTGPRYDERIKSQFPGITISNDKLMASVSHPCLPSRTFRVNHPRFLKVRGLWNEVLQRLTKAILESK